METRDTTVRDVMSGWFGSDLAPHVWDRLLELAVMRRFVTGTEIDREGEPTREFGIIGSGRIALRTFVPERGWVTTLTLEAGDIFGWSSLVPPHRASATALVVETVDAAVFEAAAFRAALAADDALAAEVYPLVLTAVARRLAATRLQLLDLFTLKEPEREPMTW